VIERLLIGRAGHPNHLEHPAEAVELVGPVEGREVL
jgi:hypothetical protein